MPRASLLDTHFSAAEQAKLAAFLDGNPTLSTDAFRDLLADKGLDVARSTAGKHRRTLSQLGERLRVTRRVMDGIEASLEDADDSTRGRAIAETMRTLIFEASMRGLEAAEGEEPDPKSLLDLARATKEVMQAARLNQDFAEREARLRRDLSDAVTEEARRLGLSEAVMDRIDQVLLG